MIFHHVGLVYLIFDMIGERQRIQSLLPGLVDPDRGPDRAIGKHGVAVKIAFQCDITRNIRDRDFDSIVDLGNGQRKRQQQKKEQVEKLTYFGWSVVHECSPPNDY